MFNTLTKDQIEEILVLEVSYLQTKLFTKQAARLTLSPDAKAEILERGYDRKYNARNIRRTIERDVMQPIARAISTLQIKHGEDIQIDFAHGEFIFYAQQPLEVNWPSQGS
jgi:ATP-dependent Clp protease ATP-binding subunit ClpA